ncbi:MAG: membrane protein insertion efficiency factor YidD [Coriobacteriales bacterium]
MTVGSLLHHVSSVPRRLAVSMVGFYRKYISPMFPPSCRYVPTCSEYAMIALQRYGFIKGSWMAIKRICRCHPWHPGGYDPVP